MSLSTGGNHPINRQKLRFQGTSSPAASSGLGATGPGGLIGKLATGLIKVKPGDGVEKFFLNTSKEGPMAIVPLESSVLVGRSERAYRRDGWLELQERLTEELAAAVVWLFGVGYLQTQFEKVANRGKNQHLSTNIAWNKPWVKTTHVDLTPQQMFARNQREINILLRLKSLRWVFSVGTALAAVGYFIPKGNQLKTNMILKHLERRKRASEGSNVQFGDPNNQNQPNGAQPVNGQTRPPQSASRPSRSLMPHLPGAVGSMLQKPNPQTRNTSFDPGNKPPSGQGNIRQSYSSITPSFNATSAQLLGQGNSNPTSNAHGQPWVRFAGGLPGLSAIQAIGAAVEQTDYGQLLAVDFGIAGGRGYVASKRSPYETAEVLFRDIVSLYFYILCAPHLMAGLTAGLDKVFDSSSHLQPGVAKLINEKIAHGLDEKKSIKHILYGEGDDLMNPEGSLREAMRKIDKKTFRGLLDRELPVYLGGKPIAADARKAMDAYLSDVSLNPSQIQHLLNAIEDGSGGFAKLSHAERQNVGIAVKQAARHTAGVKMALTDQGIKKGSDAAPSPFKALFDSMTNEKEAARLLARIKHMAQLEGMDQTHSMLRRSTNALRAELTKTGSSPLIQRGDALANWIDKAMHHARNMEEFLPEELKILGEQLHTLKLEGQPLQNISRALGGKSLSTAEDYRQALKGAKTSHLRELEKAIDELLASKPVSTLRGLTPFKTEASRIRAIKESLGSLNLKLDSGSPSHLIHESPIQALKDCINKTMDSLVQSARHDSPEKALLQHYHQAINSIVQHDEGRFFSLAVRHEDNALSQKLREMLRGGIISDSKLRSQALDTVGQLETDTRKMPGTANAEKMRKAIVKYSDAIYKRFNQANAPQLKDAALKDALKGFYALNRNLHYVARGLSLGTAMACIGWLVPVMQTKITKQLTGLDRNPGIASAKKLLDGKGKPTTQPAMTAFSAKPATTHSAAPGAIAGARPQAINPQKLNNGSAAPFKLQAKPQNYPPGVYS